MPVPMPNVSRTPRHINNLKYAPVPIVLLCLLAQTWHDFRAAYGNLHQWRIPSLSYLPVVAPKLATCSAYFTALLLLDLVVGLGFIGDRAG